MRKRCIDSQRWLGWQPVMPAAVERTGPIGEQDLQAGLDWLKHEATPQPARGTIKAAQTGGDRGAQSTGCEVGARAPAVHPEPSTASSSAPRAGLAWLMRLDGPAQASLLAWTQHKPEATGVDSGAN